MTGWISRVGAVEVDNRNAQTTTRRISEEVIRLATLLNEGRYVTNVSHSIMEMQGFVIVSVLGHEE